MTANPVYWYEGMFLQPHHLQAAERHQMSATQLGSKWDLHHNWGLRSIELRENALANHRLVIRRLEARLKDGTLVLVRPDDGALPGARPQGGGSKANQSLKVFLAVPLLRLGRANVCAEGEGEGDDGRYLLDALEIEDENNGVNQETLQFRLLNLKLLLSTKDEHPGYELLQIARIEKSAEAEAPPRLDKNYIPPVLSCDAWEPLRVDVLQNVFERIGMKIELLANLVETRGIAVESQVSSDALMIGQLRVLNEAYALLGALVFAPGVHPMQAYLELCRLVGQLAIFSREHRPPKIPVYDHDDLGGCFYRVKQQLDGLLDAVIEPEYKMRAFEGAGLRIQVPLEAAWLEPSWQMFVGVKSTLPVEECVNLLTMSGQLGMKIGSSDRVDAIHRHGSAGLRFTHIQKPPSALPSVPGLIYFQISRDSQPEEWKNVQKSLTLAARLNETRIEGNIQGQKELTVRSNGQTTKLQFTLYVVRSLKDNKERSRCDRQRQPWRDGGRGALARRSIGLVRPRKHGTQPRLKSSPRASASGDQIADLLTQPVEDARLGLANGGRCDAEVGGDDVGRLAGDGDTPKRLPGAFLEFATHQFQRAMIEAGKVFLGVVGKILIGNFLHFAIGGGAALSLGMALLLAEMIEQLAARDDAQPAAESVAGSIAAEAVQAGGDGLEDFLLNVVGVLAANAAVAAPASDQRRIEMKEALPRFAVASTDSLQQGERGRFVHCCHWRLRPDCR